MATPAPFTLVDFARYSGRRSLAQRNAAVNAPYFLRRHARRREKDVASKKIQSIARMKSAVERKRLMANRRAEENVTVLSNKIGPLSARKNLSRFLITPISKAGKSKKKKQKKANRGIRKKTNKK